MCDVTIFTVNRDIAQKIGDDFHSLVFMLNLMSLLFGPGLKAKQANSLASLFSLLTPSHVTMLTCLLASASCGSVGKDVYHACDHEFESRLK